MFSNISAYTPELETLCNTVRELVHTNNIELCYSMVAEAMGQHPHSPEPHNLFGILLEREGDHISAMKHFRAAWALDPAYLPARCNLDRFGAFNAKGEPAFDNSDCPESEETNQKKNNKNSNIHTARRQ